VSLAKLESITRIEAGQAERDLG